MNDFNIFSLWLQKGNKSFEFSEDCSKIIAAISILENKNIIDVLYSFNYPEESIAISRANRVRSILRKTNFSAYKSKYEEFKYYIRKYNFYDLDSLYSKLIDLKSSCYNDLELSVLIDTIYIKESDSKIKCYETAWKVIFYNIGKYYTKTDELIYRMNNYDKSIMISDLFSPDSIFVKIVNKIGAFFIYDLVNMPTDLLLILLLKDIEHKVTLINNLQLSIAKQYVNEIDSLEEKIKQKNNLFDIFVRRYGIFGESETLAHIALDYGLTRERIRQLELRVTKIIRDARYKITPCLMRFLDDCAKSNLYVSVEFLETEYNRRITGYTRLFISLFDLSYLYSSEYEIFYKKGMLELIEQNVLDHLSFTLTKKVYASLNKLQKNIVDKFYNLRKNGIYIKKGYTLSQIYGVAADIAYPEGVSFDESSMKKVNNILENTFEVAGLEGHSLSAALVRLDYCYIDKGTMKNRKYCAILNEDLINKIINFIYSQNDIVYYVTVFEKFKSQLEKYNVCNRYYLKGLIDRHLPSDLIKKRDYISLGNIKDSPTTVIEDYFENSTGVININYFRKKFPGIKDYIVTNIVYNHEEILQLSNGNYITEKNLNLPSGFVEALKSEIESLFHDLKIDIIHSKKIYSRMKIKFPDLMKNISYVDNHFAMFSLCRSLLKEKYGFKRPYIFEDTISLTYDTIVEKYIDEHKMFTVDDINFYLNRMSLRSLDNVLSLLISHANKFVQISVNMCISKEEFKLNENELNLIVRQLNYYIDSFGPIDTESSTIYEYLPKIRFAWNKYLLIGIIRSYLEDRYDIEYTDKTYLNTNFIIRREL